MSTNDTTNLNSKLTPKQERFCLLYAADAKFFGNATRAYIEAYNIDLSVRGAYVTARQSAKDNLTKPHILSRINQLLEDIGFTDIDADKQLAFVMAQHIDLKAKIAAIKEYNSLKQRTVQRMEVVGLRETRDKIKDFLDESRNDSGPGTDHQSNAPSAESSGPAVGPGTDQVA